MQPTLPVDSSTNSLARIPPKEDLDTDTFLYYLRDMMGNTLPNSKMHKSVADSKTTGTGHTKLLCGCTVKTKGAMCGCCRNKHLKRKFNQI